MSSRPLVWPDGVPRFVVRKCFDRRFFVWDLLHERRCTRPTIELALAQRAVHECELAARKGFRR